MLLSIIVPVFNEEKNIGILITKLLNLNFSETKFDKEIIVVNDGSNDGSRKIIEKFDEIQESIVIGQSWQNDIRVILFVVLNKGYNLNNEIKNKIKKAIRINASPRHVPSKIISISEVPKTKNGKLVELAVKQILEGEKIKNLEALANPDSLKQFKNIKELNE